MNRRDTLRLFGTGFAVAAASLSTVGRKAFAQTGASPAAPAAPAPTGPFKLPPLGYAYDALEPHIDTQTMTIHHQRHHGAYVAALNQLAQRWANLGTTDMEVVFADMNQVPEAIRTPVRNNLGGHFNHTFFWELMAPGGAKEPPAALKSAIDGAFGSAPAMMDQINTAGLGRFGSGWAWLVVDKDKKLQIVNTPNQDTPQMDLKARPVIGVDVWEHAYYLKYQNRRGDYLKAWWNTLNWDKAAENFKKASA